MSTLVWSVVTTVQGRVPLASEVCSIPQFYSVIQMLKGEKHGPAKETNRVYCMFCIFETSAECLIFMGLFLLYKENSIHFSFGTAMNIGKDEVKVNPF